MRSVTEDENSFASPCHFSNVDWKIGGKWGKMVGVSVEDSVSES